MSTAMSLYFSITIMTSVMKIFRAATSTIRPMVITVTMRSMFSAPISCLLRSIQVVVVYREPTSFSMSRAISGARSRSSTLSSMALTTSATPSSFCAVSIEV